MGEKQHTLQCIYQWHIIVQSSFI